MSLNPPLQSWTGRVIWLVGASTGIGAACAARLHRQGAQVVVSARNVGSLTAFELAHPGSWALPTDVTDSQSLHDAVAQIVARFGRIDLTLYCAGHYKAMRATAFDLNDALRHQEVNYVGALHWLGAVLPQLLAQASAATPAHLSLVASVAGYRGLPNSLAYGPTKAALINLAETLYLDLRPMGVAVSVVNPGFVATPLTASNHFHMPALLSPDQAAAAMLQGWRRGAFEIHFPKRFTVVLKLLRLLGPRLYFWAIQRMVVH